MLHGRGCEGRGHRRSCDYGSHDEEDGLLLLSPLINSGYPSGGTSNSQDGDECLRSDSGPAEQTGRREDTRLGWWREERCNAARLRNAAGGCGMRIGSSLFEGVHAIKMARTVGRGPEGRGSAKWKDGRPGRETGLLLYWAGSCATAPAAVVWME
jgi:hypothetical protein